MLDLVIKNGSVLTGVDRGPLHVDIGIKAEKIVMLEKEIALEAKRELDASGCIVSPGFIDMHSHDDVAVIANPLNEPKVMQGVTTQLMGQCGVGAAPYTPEGNDPWKRTVFALLGGGPGAWDWRTFDDYMCKMEQTGCANNNLALVSHGAVRAAAVGLENRPPKPGELAGMKALVEEAMQAGAAGLSIGLIYLPSVYGKEDEITELASVVAGHGGVFVPHGRSVGPNLIISMEEILRITEKVGVTLHIPHLQVLGKSNWPKIDRVLEKIENARRLGLQITFDQHTYTGAGTFLLAMLPPWAISGGPEEIMKNLSDPATREKIKQAILTGTTAETPGWDFTPDLIEDWDSITLTSVISEENKGIEGKTLAEISAMQNKDPYDLALDLLLQEAGLASIAIDGVYSEEDIGELIKLPHCAFGSDGIPSGHPHPRLYGTFPRILAKFVREKKKIDLAEALHKMSALPAQVLKLARRGKLREGYYADIVIFNHETVTDTATYREPKRYPGGIEYVLVNGGIVVEKGRHTGLTPGKVIRFNGN